MSALPRADLPAGTAPRPQRRPPRPPPPRRLAVPAHPRPRDRCLPHHRLQGLLPARTPLLGDPRAPRRGHGRRHCALPRPLARSLHPPQRRRASTADRRPSRRARRRTTTPRDRHRTPPRDWRGRHGEDHTRHSRRIVHRHRRPSGSCLAPRALVLFGRCLPLSVDVPLMPLCEALRGVLAQDGGRRLSTSLASCPTFVARELARLVPELGTAVTPDDSLGRQHLFTAVTTVLAALARDGRVALVLEDLHWADTVTLDLLEHVALAASAGTDGDVTFLGTWREGDLDTPAVSNQWRTRVERAPAGSTVHLGPLTRAETAAQLAGLGTEADVETVFSRSRGHPLFTTHLATHLPEDGLPHALSDLLDARLSGLAPAAWRVVRTLGVADRPLPATVVGTVAGLAPDDLADAMRSLRGLRLLGRGDDPDSAVLDHPLLAEAARRRLVPGEGRDVHRALAGALADTAAPVPAEVALHWQRAGETEEELPWRIAAARESAARFDWAHGGRAVAASARARRDGMDDVGDPPTRLSDVYLAAVDALDESFQWARGAALSAEAESRFAAADDSVRAEVLRRAAAFRGENESVSVGLALIEEALDAYRRMPEGPGLARALNRKRLLLEDLGRFDEAFAQVREAAKVAARLGDARLERYHLTTLAGQQADNGDVDGCLGLLAKAAALIPGRRGPTRRHPAGRDGERRAPQVRGHRRGSRGGGRSRAHGRSLTRRRKRDGAVPAREPRGGVAARRAGRACLRHGRRGPGRATGLRPLCAPPPPRRDRCPVRQRAGGLDPVRGGAPHDRRSRRRPVRLPGRTGRHALLDRDPNPRARPSPPFPPGQPGRRSGGPDALPRHGRVGPCHRQRGGDDGGSLSAPALGPGTTGTKRPRRQGDDGRRVRRGAPQRRPGWLARHDGVGTPALWTATASRWDDLHRPHDAAYARWRAAQCALRDGQGTVAQRLLRRAATDAGEHVLLVEAIDRTVAGAS